MSSSLIDLFTMLAEFTVIPLGNKPVANLINGICALSLMSAPTIVPSFIFADVICGTRII